MREIKFRAWDKRKKRMYYIEKLFNYRWFEFLYRGFWNLKGGDFHHEETILQSDNGILMQYTGLKDKNGKEIYERDICKDKDGYVFVVNYEYNEFEDGDCVGFAINETVEVIGNIYENPELIKGVEE